MRVLFLTAICFLLFAQCLAAQRIEGKDAPSFTMGGVVNRDGPVELSDMAGDIVVIKIWGIT
ncbi:MAG: hypothetical protein H6839_04165 [Planctomycetes bacterium]|nr:hypothetical protein [Planctomycetota bacterium]